MEEENNNIQEKALSKYGDNFTEEFFYGTVSQDNSYLKMFNAMVNKYLGNQLKIIIKNRSKDKLTGKWILKNLYLPI